LGFSGRKIIGWLRRLRAAHPDLALNEGAWRAPGSGDKVPVDPRLIRSKGLRLEEAASTGESVPIEHTSQSAPGSQPSVGMTAGRPGSHGRSRPTPRPSSRDLTLLLFELTDQGVEVFGLALQTIHDQGKHLLGIL